MRRFIDGNEQQYDWLRDQIQGMRYTFNDVSLPNTCTPNTCRMSFEFTPANGYKVYIDNNIIYTGQNESYRRFLSSGEASFENYEALKQFLRSLNCLYVNTPLARRNTSISSNQNRDTTISPETHPDAAESVFRTACLPVEVDIEQLHSNMISKIIGQNDVLSDMVDATQIHLAQVKPKRPATIFIAGPTGVGKTESVNVLVETLNQITDVNFTFIRIDCNQLMESHRVSQLLGSPQGYVGYGDPPMLAPLADNPRCIILWDEIEKAHSNILKALMSAMDNGMIRLPSPINEMNEIDCRYSIFIFTSNLLLKNEIKTIGFLGTEEKLTALGSEEDRCKEALVKNNISPEIAGRIAWFLQYKPLTEQDIAKVIRLEIEQCANSYELSVKEINSSIIDELIQSTGSKFGMRAYKQLINRKFGKTFAVCKHKDIGIKINGNLDALKIVPVSDRA